jgi:hypothetical protein
MEDSCEHGNELSDSIKFLEFLEYLLRVVASQEGLSIMESVIYISRSCFLVSLAGTINDSLLCAVKLVLFCIESVESSSHC